MKAIYINLDPYLAAFAAWLKGGKSGPAPTGPSTPLAVTVPLGETAGIYIVADAEDAENACEEQSITVDGQSMSVLTTGTDTDGVPTAIAFRQAPAFSALAPTLKYAVVPVTGDVSTTIMIFDGADVTIGLITFTVLVRREQAQGPVDLVDFTPPAS